MTGPPPATAAVRVAVRRCLAGLSPARPVAAAVSGGPDSLALAAALAFERPGSLALVVDHGLQTGSADVAVRAAARCRDLGLDAHVLGPEPAGPEPAGPGPVGPEPAGPAGGPEAAARSLRYRLLDDAARRLDLAAVLLGHTLDDQAETVLLALARGSGTRTLAGMPASRGRYRRPLLGLDRATVRAACAQAGLPAHDDAHNADPAFARVRVRAQALPVLEAALGPGVAAALARTAASCREDADALDALTPDLPDEPACADLAVLPPALRARALKRWAERRCGAAVTATHVRALRALVEAWRGQGGAALPGGVVVERRAGRLVARGHRPADTGRRHSTSGRPAPASLDAVSAPARQDLTAHPDIERVLVSEQQIAQRVAELAVAVDAQYAGREVLLVGVLKGAVMFMADFARALRTPVAMEFMAVSSYGSATSSSGVVRIMKDLDRGIEGQHVLVVEDIIDSGLTLSWLLRNLTSRGPASVDVVALLRKPEALKVEVPVAHVGFDIPSEFVVGYGLDYAERYRDLPFVGTLRPEVYST